MTTQIFQNDAEILRLTHMQIFEEDAYQKGYQCVVGIDEAGRGPLAGPVVACACFLPRHLLIPLIDDSKKLKPNIRQQIFKQLLEDSSVCYGIGYADSHEIDEINIYQATMKAMERAIQQLSMKPDFLLVDGLALPHLTIPSLKIIKGDQLSQSIAAASIIAKETRDALMIEFDKQWPQYGFKRHKGYGTQEHLKAIESFGPCSIHRKSFDPIRSQLEVLSRSQPCLEV